MVFHLHILYIHAMECILLVDTSLVLSCTRYPHSAFGSHSFPLSHAPIVAACSDMEWSFYTALFTSIFLRPSSRHQLTEWLDVLKTSLRLTEHTPSPSRSPSSSSSSTTLPPTSRSLSPLLSKRSAPKRKSLKRGSSFRTGRIEEEEGVVLARAIVTTGSSDKPVSGAAPGNIDHLSFSTLTS